MTRQGAGAADPCLVGAWALARPAAFGHDPGVPGWLETKVAGVHTWAPGLVTLTLEARLDFRAGQFVYLALQADTRVSRSYSMASAPGAPLEFFLVGVEGGALSPSLVGLEVGAPVQVQSLVAGHFTLERVPDARDLWLVATGTGLGPYISMLRTDEPWQRFERVIVVHGVRHARHLAYRDELQGRDLTWVPLVSREDCPEALPGRVSDALASGALEARAGVTLDPAHSQVLLCGNPAMIADMRRLLDARGLTRNRPRAPGQVTFEKYWG